MRLSPYGIMGEKIIYKLTEKVWEWGGGGGGDKIYLIFTIYSFMRLTNKSHAHQVFIHPMYECVFKSVEIFFFTNYE